MFKFIHVADIHLDSPLKGLEAHEGAPVDEIRGASRRAFDNLIALALEEEVRFVVIAGDLYDGDWKDYQTGLFFTSRMGRLLKAEIKVFMVSGNHDAASQITKVLPLPDNVTLFSSKKPQSVKLDDIGVIIHGQSYAHRVVTDNVVLGYPQHLSGYFNIGLLHTSLTGRQGHENYAPCNLDELTSKGYDYWALGHVHQREIVSQAPWVVFPGNLQGRHVREPGAKGAFLVTVDDGRVVDVADQELDVVRWIIGRADLSGCQTPDDVYAAVRQTIEQERDSANGKTLALRLVLTGKCPVHGQLLDRTDQWTEEFRGIAAVFGDVWLEKVQYRTRRHIHLDSVLGDQSPIAGLVKSIQRLPSNDESLLDQVPELAALRSKLPPEIHSGDAPFLALSPEEMVQLHTEVRELLIAKLLTHGED